MTTVRIRPGQREQCLSCGICVAICPEVFSIGEDGKVVVHEKWRQAGDPGTGSIPDELAACARAAASACPISIIEVG